MVRRELVAAAPKGSPANVGARKLELELNKIADQIKNYNAVTPEALRPLREVVTSLKPKTGQLYKLNGTQD